MSESVNIKLTAFEDRMDEKLIKMKKDMKERAKFENSINKVSGVVKQINDKIEILESKTDVINRQTEKHVNSVAFWSWERKNFAWD